MSIVDSIVRKETVVVQSHTVCFSRHAYQVLVGGPKLMPEAYRSEFITAETSVREVIRIIEPRKIAT